MALLWRELSIQVGSSRFRVAAVLIMSLMVVSAWIHAVRYQAELEVVDGILVDYAEDLEDKTVRSLVRISHPAVKPPWRLAFIVEGEQMQVTNVYRQKLSAFEDQVSESTHGFNIRLPPAEALDWLFVIRIVASLAAFVLAYDSICGRRQHARLKTTLSYPVGRFHVLLAKFLALWTSLALAFLTGAVLSLVLARWYGAGIEGTGGKIALVMLLGVWGIGLFVLVAMMVSALNREATRSLAILALVWVSGVVVLPTASSLLALAFRPVSTSLEIARMEEEAKVSAETKRGGPGSWRGGNIGLIDGFAVEREASLIEADRVARQRHVRRQAIELQFQQLAFARDLASISPMMLIQDLAERAVGTGRYRDRAFLEQAMAHRDVLAWFVLRLDQRDPESHHVYFIWDHLSESGFDAAEVPRFRFREATLDDCLRRSWSRWLLLMGMTGVILALTMLAFARYDLG